MKKLLIAASTIALVGCQTTSKPLSLAKQTEILNAQAKQEQKDYLVKYNEIVPSPMGNVALVGRTCITVSGKCQGSDTYLNLVENKSAKKAGAAIALGVVATVATGMLVSDRLGFRKDELKGKVLEPKLPNPALDYAKPALQNWIKTSVTQFSPTDKPINKVIIQLNRFYLVYEKLTGEKTYQLRNSFDIGLENSPFSASYWYHCDEESTPKLLSQWQANDYNEVKLAVQKNVQSCISKLNTQQQASYKLLSKSK